MLSNSKVGGTLLHTVLAWLNVSMEGMAEL